MIVLSNQTPFAGGGNRLCFVHPDEPDRCVKVLRPHQQGHLVRQRHRIPRNLRSAKHYDDNERERRGYDYVNSIRDEAVWLHIPRYYGRVQTDIGYGSVTQLMRDFDGAISKTLRQRLYVVGRKTQPDDAYLNSINELLEFIRRTSFLSRYLTPQNILSVRLSENRERLYLIEGFGPAQWIPIVRYISILKKLKIDRIISRFEQRLKEEIVIVESEIQDKKNGND